MGMGKLKYTTYGQQLLAKGLPPFKWSKRNGIEQPISILKGSLSLFGITREFYRSHNVIIEGALVLQQPYDPLDQVHLWILGVDYGALTESVPFRVIYMSNEEARGGDVIGQTFPTKGEKGYFQLYVATGGGNGVGIDNREMASQEITKLDNLIELQSANTSHGFIYITRIVFKDPPAISDDYMWDPE